MKRPQDRALSRRLFLEHRILIHIVTISEIRYVMSRLVLEGKDVEWAMIVNP